MQKLSQIPWDPTRFVGFSIEQVNLIQSGWNAALDAVYERETHPYRYPENLGRVELADPEDMEVELEEVRTASEAHLDAAFEAGCEDGAFQGECWPDGRVRAAYIDGWNRSNPDDQRG